MEFDGRSPCHGRNAPEVMIVMVEMVVMVVIRGIWTATWVRTIT